jgi:hypothetical protein
MATSFRILIQDDRRFDTMYISFSQRFPASVSEFEGRANTQALETKTLIRKSTALPVPPVFTPALHRVRSGLASLREALILRRQDPGRSPRSLPGYSCCDPCRDQKDSHTASWCGICGATRAAGPAGSGFLLRSGLRRRRCGGFRRAGRCQIRGAFRGRLVSRRLRSCRERWLSPDTLQCPVR